MSLGKAIRYGKGHRKTIRQKCNKLIDHAKKGRSALDWILKTKTTTVGKLIKGHEPEVVQYICTLWKDIFASRGELVVAKGLRDHWDDRISVGSGKIIFYFPLEISQGDICVAIQAAKRKSRRPR